MVYVDVEALGNFYLPPMDLRRGAPEAVASAGQIALRLCTADESCEGAVLTQVWHGKATDPWDLATTYHELTMSAHKLGKLTGTTELLSAAGIRTEVVDLPETDRQPASTVAAMTYTTAKQFCQLANCAVSGIRIGGETPQFIADDSPEPRFGAATLLDDSSAGRLRISTSLARGHLFSIHDQADHGAARLVALRKAPELVATFRAEALNFRGSASNTAAGELLDLSDLVLSTATLLRTATGDEDNPGWQEFSQHGLTFPGGVDGLREQLIA